MNTGIQPHHLYTQMNAGVAARNISITENNAAIPIAFTSLNDTPLNLSVTNNLLLGSAGIILEPMIPAIENIIESSQDTPTKSTNELLAFETVHKGYPVACPMIAFIIS